MKLLTSGFGLAILALLMNILTTAGTIFMERDVVMGRKPAAGGATAQALPHFWSFRPDEVDALISDLKDQREKLIARQTDLDKLAAHIEAERRELEKTRADVAAIQDQITTEIPQIKDSEKKNIKALSQTYATMTPTATVAIFRQLDDNTCVKLLAQMKPDKVGAILEEMSIEDKDQTLTKRAARISDKLRLMNNTPAPTPAA